jgi:hypothetical protein
MPELRIWKHEKFAQLVASGDDPRTAYTIAGYAPNRANHNKLLRRPEIVARIEQIRIERATKARAAQLSAEAVLEHLRRCGVESLADLFERDAAGTLGARDLQAVPVEASIALFRLLSKALRIPNALAL